MHLRYQIPDRYFSGVIKELFFLAGLELDAKSAKSMIFEGVCPTKCMRFSLLSFYDPKMPYF